MEKLPQMQSMVPFSTSSFFFSQSMVTNFTR